MTYPKIIGLTLALWTLWGVSGALGQDIVRIGELTNTDVVLGQRRRCGP